jgi:hypothetical protein
MPNVTSVWDFSPGDTLTAAKLDDVNCGIHVFSGTATRDAAYGGSGERTLAEGEFAYLADSNVTQYYDGAAWQTVSRILQVTSTALTSTYTDSSASGTLATITGLSATLTPSSASNKVLVMASVTVGGTDGSRFVFGLTGGNSATAYIGDAASNRKRVATGQIPAEPNGLMQVSLIFLDSPATTSATTYSVQTAAIAGETVYINRAGTDTDNANHARGASTITVMEISA